MYTVKWCFLFCSFSHPARCRGSHVNGSRKFCAWASHSCHCSVYCRGIPEFYLIWLKETKLKAHLHIERFHKKHSYIIIWKLRWFNCWNQFLKKSVTYETLNIIHIENIYMSLINLRSYHPFSEFSKTIYMYFLFQLVKKSKL